MKGRRRHVFGLFVCQCFGENKKGRPRERGLPADRASGGEG
ncbi:hypothetical protein SAMN05443582_103280 [Phyllobacterium sp. OV277]|nr:hypothetical protein SAMN05443582_103280 [Phyllobacterium sp. OV277]